MNEEDLEPLRKFLKRWGLSAHPESATVTPLTGGVSSDLWRIDLPERAVCVKRALPRLRVADEWHAPIDRNAVEYAWLEMAANHRPGNVPKLLARDVDAGLFAMEYLPYPVWKAELMAGRVEPTFAAKVGLVLGDLHQASAADPTLMKVFATGENFDALRLEPYLRVTARRHPAMAPTLLALANRTSDTSLAVVHGDVSPKNILVGPRGPVFLDAECAWWGDPAFDLAFCLNHLLLKCVWTPAAAPGFLACFDALASAYVALVDWEPPAALEARAARLLPGLFLARVDGKSPVEYLTRESERAAVRQCAEPLVANPPPRLKDVADAWERAR